MRLLRIVIMLLAVCGPALCWAQAGPPLITNDPDTPGNGNWEINLAATGAHNHSGWGLAAPDVDINYGWGERVQVSVHIPWNHQRGDDGRWLSGAGPAEWAIRWRFVDEKRAGFSLAIQPHWVSAWSSATIRKGLASANDEFVLPIQASRKLGAATVGLEISRHFVMHEGDERQAGAFWSRDCRPGLQCLAEINTVWPASGPAEAVLNIGARKTVSEHLLLLGSFGRQFTGAAERQQFLFYLGVQLLR